MVVLEVVHYKLRRKNQCLFCSHGENHTWYNQNVMSDYIRMTNMKIDQFLWRFLDLSQGTPSLMLELLCPILLFSIWHAWYSISFDGMKLHRTVMYIFLLWRSGISMFLEHDLTIISINMNFHMHRVTFCEERDTSGMRRSSSGSKCKVILLQRS